MKQDEFKNRLRIAMEELEMKQADLVNVGHFDKGQLSAWLSGKYKPRQDTLGKLAEILGVDEAWLMGFDVPKKRRTDAEKFLEYAEAYSKTHSPVMLSDHEKEIIERYRLCDGFGKDVIEAVISKEYERCIYEKENSITLTREMLEQLPFEDRLNFLKYEDDDLELKVARKSKKE